MKTLLTTAIIAGIVQTAFAAGTVLPATVLSHTDAVTIYQGGYGSSAAADPTDSRRFFALTDRGPNADGKENNVKIFPIPDYAPRIGHFEIQKNGKVKLLKNIVLKRPDGQPLTGLPNPEGYGATGEIAVDVNGNRLPTDRYGLDGEGLVVMRDGSFWVSDEYGPHIVHFSANGIELERISPKGLKTDGRKLPAVFANRRANRGMEGLTLTPDGQTLVGIMQSTLFNPNKKAATNRTLTRIVTFDLQSGKTHQYLYRQNQPNLSNSEILALDNHRFLVNERDGDFNTAEKKAQKHVYLIDLRSGTEVSDPQDRETGLTIHGKALEEWSWEDLAAANIYPVQKKLAADLIEAVRYPHDKFEGMWLSDGQTLTVVNDDDFGIAAKAGTVIAKTLPATGQADAVTLYRIPLKFKP